jgi:thiamine biosynthesis lipoprotein
MYSLNSRALSSILLLTILLAGCQPQARQFNYSIFAFGTLIDVTFYDIDATLAETAFDQLQEDFRRYHQDWSPWTDGDLAQLNEALKSKQKIPVPEHLLPIIRESIELSRQSDNYYNPAIGHLINAWQFHRYQEEGIRPPPQRDLQRLLKSDPKMSDLTLDDENRLDSSNTAVSLNFGAFAKGYAIALEMDMLKKMGIDNAVINAGGDLSVIGRVITRNGEKKDNREWNIGIRHPRNSSILASVQVHDNESVFTSGDYERFYHYQGQRYHHILDPATGYPTRDSQSVTVIHADAGRADAAATALFVAGRKHWQRIAKNMGIEYVMLIDSDNNVHMTEKMAERVKFLEKQPTLHKIISQQL